MRRVFLLAAVFLLPSATAMELQVELDEPLLDPGLAPKPMALTVTTTCGEILPLMGADGEPLQVVFSYELPPGIVTAGSTNMFLDATACAGTSAATSVTATNQAQLGATFEAPGLRELQGSATATISSKNPAAESLSSSTAWTFAVDYHGAASMQIAKPLLDASPGEAVEFELLLENFGNAPTVFTFVAKAEQPNVFYPEPIVLDARGERSTGTVSIMVRSDGDLGWNNDQQAIIFDVVTHAQADPEKEGNTLAGSLLLRNRGLGGLGGEAVGSPSPGLPLLVAAAGLAVTLRRRA